MIESPIWRRKVKLVCFPKFLPIRENEVRDADNEDGLLDATGDYISREMTIPTGHRISIFNMIFVRAAYGR